MIFKSTVRYKIPTRFRFINRYKRLTMFTFVDTDIALYKEMDAHCSNIGASSFKVLKIKRI